MEDYAAKPLLAATEGFKQVHSSTCRSSSVMPFAEHCPTDKTQKAIIKCVHLAIHVVQLQQKDYAP